MIRYIVYSMGMFFMFYLVNHAEITDKPINWLFNKLPINIVKAFQCAFCFAWWISIPMAIFGIINWWYIICSPVINIFTNLIFLRLCEDHPRVN